MTSARYSLCDFLSIQNLGNIWRDIIIVALDFYWFSSNE